MLIVDKIVKVESAEKGVYFWTFGNDILICNWIAIYHQYCRPHPSQGSITLTETKTDPISLKNGSRSV